MSETLSEGKTPEAWSKSLSGHGVHVSARLIRRMAREAGQFHQIGRLMLLTPEHLEALLKRSGRLQSD